MPDLERLGAWMSEHVPGYRGPLAATAFEGGQSNPTFKLVAASGDYVLRRKPVGHVLQSAHSVDREFRVLQALGDTDVPVPKVYALCMDDAVIGSAFYVMEFLTGRVFFDPRLPDLSPADRAALFASMIDTIAKLHRIDPAAVGLADYGRPTQYMQRQFARWSKQYRLAETAPIASMDRLIDWLPERLPDSGITGIVHGDLRLDNMLIHPTEPRVIALLDWELSTLGDPLSDLAGFCLTWRLEPDLFRGLRGVDLESLGLPTETQMLDSYSAHVGRAGLPGWETYIVFNLFRLAAIFQGIARRALDGNASSANAAIMGAKATPTADRGWALAEAGAS